MGIQAHYLQDRDKNKFYPYSHADASYDRNGVKVGKRLDDIDASLKNKVEKISGKGLSTNDYTTTEKNKLSGIESNAQVNVQPDWNATDVGSDAYIKNKPTSLPANGGDADTVNGHTVAVDVPANAKFTDTVYVHPSGTNPHGTTKSDVGLGNVPNVATNDQTPTFTEATSLQKLTSGEKISLALGKISKAISDLISHISDNVKHITSTERTNWGKAYTHSTSAHAPSSAQANVIESVQVNGTALTPSSKAVNIAVPTKTSELENDAGFKTIDTTYSAMTGATASAAGSAGLVPAPAAGKQTSFLRGDGTWQPPLDNIANNLTTTESGYALDARQGKELKGLYDELNGKSYDLLEVPKSGITWIVEKNHDGRFEARGTYSCYCSQNKLYTSDIELPFATTEILGAFANPSYHGYNLSKWYINEPQTYSNTKLNLAFVTVGLSSQTDFKFDLMAWGKWK